jgi:hypothetical protein
MNAQPLIPCPFCGSPGKLGYNEGNENWPQRWWGTCTASSCGVSGKAFFGSNTWAQVGKEEDARAKQDAIDFWNTRATGRTA